MAVVIAALLWSVDGLLRRHLYTLPPSVIVFYEHILGIVFLVPFLWSTRSKFRELTRKQWWAMGLVALLSGALGTISLHSCAWADQFHQFFGGSSAAAAQSRFRYRHRDTAVA
ncbi:EamA family transporter [Candidatus Saccharibacteria bacterium]|nr:MAG: EamA family transporter [Candidatus Saccharibacteria bacterium]